MSLERPCQVVAYSSEFATSEIVVKLARETDNAECTVESSLITAAVKPMPPESVRIGFRTTGNR